MCLHVCCICVCMCVYMHESLMCVCVYISVCKCVFRTRQTKEAMDTTSERSVCETRLIAGICLGLEADLTPGCH